MRLDDDRVDAARNERLRLLSERILDPACGNVAVGLEESAERSEITEDEASFAVERLARDLSGGAVDGSHTITFVVSLEHDARTAERIRNDTIGAGVDISFLDRENFLGCVDIPRFAARARLEAGSLKLGSHRAVAQENAFFQGVEEAHAVLRKPQRKSHFEHVVDSPVTTARRELTGFNMPEGKSSTGASAPRSFMSST